VFARPGGERVTWWLRNKKDSDRQLEALRASLSKPPSLLPLQELFPVLLPAAIFQAGGWPGPFRSLKVEGLAQTWVVLQPEQTMRYVDHQAEAYWTEQGIDWRAVALDNLRRASRGSLWTHEFRRESSELFAVGMMHPDGIGPARLLLSKQLLAEFPAGYLVSVPERSCGLVLSRKATDAEAAQIHDVAARCYEHGTNPVLPGFYSSGDLNPVDGVGERGGRTSGCS
jgi:hypothetical protein